jgi:hypothetical protein
MTNSYKGQATVYIAILAFVAGIVAFVVIYGMNSRQNFELANDIAQSVEGVDVTSPEMEDRTCIGNLQRVRVMPGCASFPMMRIGGLLSRANLSTATTS